MTPSGHLKPLQRMVRPLPTGPLVCASVTWRKSKVRLPLWSWTTRDAPNFKATIDLLTEAFVRLAHSQSIVPRRVELNVGLPCYQSVIYNRVARKGEGCNVVEGYRICLRVWILVGYL